MTNAEEILEFQQLVRMVPIAERWRATRSSWCAPRVPTDASAPDFVKKYVNFGASVRAAQFLVLARQGARADARPLSRHLRRRPRAGRGRSCATAFC